jgi:short-subunit dehydrogenase
MSRARALAGNGLDGRRVATGSHALVVGGSSGIGLAIGEALGDAGYLVSNLSRRPAPAGAAAASYACDVTSGDQVERAVALAVGSQGPCDVLVYAAGIPAMGRTCAVPEAIARRCFEVNFWGLDRVVRAVLPAMMERRRGAVLVVSSLVALRPVPFESYYAASKAAAVRYLGCLAHEARRGGVRVHALHVGLVGTGFFERGGWYGMEVPGVSGSGVTPARVARAAMDLLASTAESSVLGWKERLIVLGDRLAPTLYDRFVRLRRPAR